MSSRQESNYWQPIGVFFGSFFQTAKSIQFLTALFFFRQFSFVFKPPPLLSRRNPGRFSFFGGDGHSANHFSQFVENIGDIAALIAKALAGEKQVAVGRDLTFVSLSQLGQHVCRQRSCFGQIPMQLYLRIYLVNVLSARTTGAGIGKLEFP